MLALGGDCLSDIAVLRAEPELFGPVASNPTASRLVTALAGAGPQALRAIRKARAAARVRAWELAGEHAPWGNPGSDRGRSGRHDRARALQQAARRPDVEAHVRVASGGSPTSTGTASPALSPAPGPAASTGSSPTWNCATAAGPAAKTASAVPRTPACATCPCTTSPPTRSGSNWQHWPRTYCLHSDARLR